jgi:hypothetical protein
LGGGVGSLDVFGCELVGRGFGIGVKVEVNEVWVLDDGVDDVVVVVSWFGLDKSITNAFGHVNCVLGVR